MYFNLQKCFYIKPGKAPAVPAAPSPVGPSSSAAAGGSGQSPPPAAPQPATAAAAARFPASVGRFVARLSRTRR
eukprot:15453016-Alexandrium_andersonii.AAC.1